MDEARNGADPGSRTRNLRFTNSSDAMRSDESPCICSGLVAPGGSHSHRSATPWGSDWVNAPAVEASRVGVVEAMQ